MTPRRVLVTAGATPTAAAIADHVLAQPDVESVLLVDEHRPDPLPAAEFLSAENLYGELRDLIVDHGIDAVIHAGLAPDRDGTTTRHRRADVITTMRVAAVAADPDGPVRTLVAVSSSARYVAHSGAPTLQSETGRQRTPKRGGQAASIAEAEDYLVALAERHPNLSISILRFADLVGPGVTSPLASMLYARRPPRIFGYDPMVQFLHIDDAAHAVEHALRRSLAGTFNVATPGLLPWSHAIGLVGRRSVWGVPTAPHPGMSRVLQFGRTIATERLIATGWEPAHSISEVLTGNSCASPARPG
jgi:UDP-glucose 4-epimerase